MRIFIAQIFHETNTFAPGVTDEARFATGAYCRGEAVREKYAHTRHYIGGMLDTAEAANAETVLSVSIGTAGPTISRECLDHYVNEILEDLTPEIGRIDGICLALHGAGVAEGIDDIEAYTLRRIRALVGRDMPITASLDLHTNLSSDMIALADGLFSLKTYPHIDTWEAGSLAMTCLLNILKTGKKPVITACRLPLLAPFTNMCTDRESPAQEVRDFMLKRKAETGVFDISFLHGFCYADIPEAGMAVLVVSDREEKALCDEIAAFAWARRERMTPAPVSVRDAMGAAAARMQSGRLTIVVEGSDHGGGGGPNDGTFLLNELLKRNVPRSAFVSIYDPDTAAKCHALGVGGVFTGLLGGKEDHCHGDPIVLKDAKILGLSDGHFRYTTPMYLGQPYCVGKTARLLVGNVEIIVNSVPRQTHDDRMLSITGSDVNNYDLLCIKSGLAFKAFYTALPNFEAFFPCDPPGCMNCDLLLFDFKRVVRPVYPLDAVASPRPVYL